MSINGYELSYESVVGGIVALLVILLFFILLLVRKKKRIKEDVPTLDHDPLERVAPDEKASADETTYEAEDDLFHPVEELTKVHSSRRKEKDTKEKTYSSQQKLQEFLVLQWPAVGMRICPYCGVENSPDTAECIVCAKQIV